SDEPVDQKWLQLLRLKVQAAEARVAALPAIQAAHLRAANAGVRAAEAQVEAAEAELALLEAGPTAAEVEQAEAEVRQAKADRRAAVVALARATLRAPFDGVVTQVHVEVGAHVSPEHPALVLAALDHLRLKTLDATELDVVHLAVGQEVRVTVDALPDQSFTGHITRIKQQSVDYRGDVTYPVLIELESPPPELRWGMTALVEVAEKSESPQMSLTAGRTMAEAPGSPP
ncbi:MAG: efflux RND transporter periplasmic adaptor subunit, partial [Anaerolineales bacterium]